MRNSKNKGAAGNKPHPFKGNSPNVTISPSPMVFGGKKSKPEDLKRQISTPAQRDGFEEIILYGKDNALPLHIAKAVEESPAASSCIATVSKFIKGSGFSDKELMKLVVDQNGTTLWDLHCSLADSLALFWGFSVNFKYDKGGRIINAYQMSFENCRFKEPGENSPYITEIKFNPYYGTTEYNPEYTKSFPVFDPKEVHNQMSALPADKLKDFPGQIYYYGKTSPLSRFYPKPRYWSAKEAILADHKLQEFNNEELENGFFQSVLINAIGDPSKWSNNPRLMKEELQSDGVTKKKVATKTVGEEFNDQMSTTFSGSNKAGTAMVLWSLSPDTAIKIAPFPTGINGDRLIATQNSVTKTITIATEVPSILANISEGVSLGSNGNEMQKAVELMQSRTVEWREILMGFYNNILLPNLKTKPKGEAVVEIQNYNPITVPIEINDKVWEFLNEEEKTAFIKKNMPEIEIIRTQTALPAPTEPETDPETGEPLPVQPAPAAPNEALKDINSRQLDRILSIVGRYNIGLVDPSNKKALTFEQAKTILLSYGIAETEIPMWLSEPNEEV